MVRRGHLRGAADFSSLRITRGDAWPSGQEHPMSGSGLRAIILLLALVSGFHARSASAAAGSRAGTTVAPTTAALERATQALVDALAPGQRAVWEHYADAALTYVTEDNEVKSRTELLADMKPLPPGSSGWIVV